MNRTELDAVRTYPELRRLIDLKQSGGWTFHQVIVDGKLELLAGSRVWLVGGWSDALAIRDRTDAKAYRCNSEGGVVWKREDILAVVLDKLIELPRPNSPNAPKLVIGTRPILWLPGMPP